MPRLRPPWPGRSRRSSVQRISVLRVDATRPGESTTASTSARRTVAVGMPGWRGRCPHKVATTGTPAASMTNRARYMTIRVRTTPGMEERPTWRQHSLPSHHTPAPRPEDRGGTSGPRRRTRKSRRPLAPSPPRPLLSFSDWTRAGKQIHVLEIDLVSPRRPSRINSCRLSWACHHHPRLRLRFPRRLSHAFSAWPRAPSPLRFPCRLP